MKNSINIIFLDIDGVLNSYISIANNRKKEKYSYYYDIPDYRHIKQLNIIIKKTKAKIVISSSWRTFTDIKTLSMLLLAQGLTKEAEIIGYTPILSNEKRGKEIKYFLDSIDTECHLLPKPIKVNSYLILDDDEDMLKEQESFFIQTDIMTGLNSSHVKKAIKILRKEN